MLDAELLEHKIVIQLVLESTFEPHGAKTAQAVSNFNIASEMPQCYIESLPNASPTKFSNGSYAGCLGACA